MNEQREALDNLAEAFGILGKMLQWNGRRFLRAELESKMRFHRPDPLSQARTAPMAKRRKRREVVRAEQAKGKDAIFRPVLGYVGIPVTDHKQAIAALKSMTVGASAWAGVREMREKERVRVTQS